MRSQGGRLTGRSTGSSVSQQGGGGEYKGGPEVVGVAGAVGALFLVFSFLSKVGIKIIGLENGRTWRMQCDCLAA